MAQEYFQWTVSHGLVKSLKASEAICSINMSSLKQIFKYPVLLVVAAVRRHKIAKNISSMHSMMTESVHQSSWNPHSRSRRWMMGLTWQLHRQRLWPTWTYLRQWPYPSSVKWYINFPLILYWNCSRQRFLFFASSTKLFLEFKPTREPSKWWWFKFSWSTYKLIMFNQSSRWSSVYISPKPSHRSRTHLSKQINNQ